MHGVLTTKRDKKKFTYNVEAAIGNDEYHDLEELPLADSLQTCLHEQQIWIIEVKRLLDETKRSTITVLLWQVINMCLTPSRRE